MIKRKPGASLFARIRQVLTPSPPPDAQRVVVVEECRDGEHDWEQVDKFGVPPLWRCGSCGAYGFVKRKGNGLRNGRMVGYQCSTDGCKKPAKIRSKHRGTGGAYDWACCPEHAKSPKFEGRIGK